MIAVDTNLLLYAHVQSYRQHEPARDWLEAQLGGQHRVGLPWTSLLGFTRLVVNPRVFPEPESVADAWAQVRAWLDAEPAWTPVPTHRHREILGTCLADASLRANDVPDAHLAALCMEHGLRLATADEGFARFSGLKWFNPLRG